MLLFDPIKINDVTIPNRIVKSAMDEGLGDHDGRPQTPLIKLYESWAKGGVGLAITGMAYIRKHHSFTGHDIGLYEDALIEPLRTLTDAVHRHGGKVFAQICHAPPQLPRENLKRLGAVAPSARFYSTSMLYHRSLTDAEIQELVSDFAQAASRAKRAGFDGIQLHGAHGYLISRFLSPLYNKRKDRYGSSFDGRLTFLKEIYLAIRSNVGSSFPITIKLNAKDGCRKGLTLETSLNIGKKLQKWGFDAIEVSAGTAEEGLSFYPNRGKIPIELGKDFLRKEFPSLRFLLPFTDPILRAAARRVEFTEEAYFFQEANQFADILDIPIICVGGIRSKKKAEEILTKSRIAMISMARPLLRQPDLPNLWKDNRSLVATCTSCNQCFVSLGLYKSLACRLHNGE